jgi:molybdopterin molybdotransferase
VPGALRPSRRSIIGRLLGRSEESAPLQQAIADCDLEANGDRQHYMRATSRWDPEGVRLVTSLPSQDSSLMAAFAAADCLIVREAGAPAARRGDRIAVMPLDF